MLVNILSHLLLSPINYLTFNFGFIPAAVIGAAGTLLGAKMSADAAGDANAANYQMNKEFAQHGIRWKVEDAKAAGIHPLAALGAQTNMPTAQMISEDMGQGIRQGATALSNSLMQAAIMDKEADTRLKISNARLADEKAAREALAKMKETPRDFYQDWNMDGQRIRLPHTDLPLEIQNDLLYMELLRRGNPDNVSDILFGPEAPPPKGVVPHSGSGRGVPDLRR